MRDNPDGTVDLSARDLLADDADAAYNYVNALAKALEIDGDPRSIDAIRADVVLELLRGGHPADLFPAESEQGPAAPAQATATPEGARPLLLQTAARLRPAHPGEPPADQAVRGVQIRPARAEGGTGREETAAINQMTYEQLTHLRGSRCGQGGPVERRLLITQAAHRIKDALAPLNIHWCALAVDTDGNPVHGHHGYRPPAAMRRLVQARDGSSSFPGCDRPAAQCDLDHTIPHHVGGPTCPCNLAALCRSHHRLKQHPDWTLIRLWPGVLLWISPTGHWYLGGADP